MQTDYDDEVCFRAVQKLRDLSLRRRATRPFFLTVSFTNPHDPWEVAAALLGSLRRARDRTPGGRHDPPRRGRSAQPAAARHEPARRAAAQRRRGAARTPRLLRRDQLPRRARRRAARRAQRDGARRLDARGLHGRPRRAARASAGSGTRCRFLEGSARVPLIARGPGLAAAARARRRVAARSRPDARRAGGRDARTGRLRGHEPRRCAHGRLAPARARRSASTWPRACTRAGGDAPARRPQVHPLSGRPRSALRPGGRSAASCATSPSCPRGASSQRRSAPSATRAGISRELEARRAREPARAPARGPRAGARSLHAVGLPAVLGRLAASTSAARRRGASGPADRALPGGLPPSAGAPRRTSSPLSTAHPPVIDTPGGWSKAGARDELRQAPVNYCGSRSIRDSSEQWTATSARVRAHSCDRLRCARGPGGRARRRPARRAFNGTGFHVGSGRRGDDLQQLENRIPMIVQADGKIVAGGSRGGSMTLVRYNTNGSIDTSFGTGGFVDAAVRRHAVADDRHERRGRHDAGRVRQHPRRRLRRLAVDGRRALHGRRRLQRQRRLLRPAPDRLHGARARACARTAASCSSATDAIAIRRPRSRRPGRPCSTACAPS